MPGEVNKERMRSWIDALRSGEFEQGQAYLRCHDPDGMTRYCCVGVLCEVAIRQGVPLEIQEDTSGPRVTWFDETSQFMPIAVAEWLGIDPDDFGELQYCPLCVDGEHMSPYEANDSRQLTFEQIADGLERMHLLERCHA